MVTERRRFFPSQRVQFVPGVTAEVELQLTPQQRAAAPSTQTPPDDGGEGGNGGCECEPIGVAVLPDMHVDGDWVESGSMYAVNAVVQGWRLVGGYMPIRYSEWELPLKLRAFVVGKSVCDVSWQWSLDVPTPWPTNPANGEIGEWDGVEVQEQDGTLAIHIKHSRNSEYLIERQPWWCQLTLTATCGGKPAGTAIIRPGINLYSSDIPPIEVPTL